jgi:hypothetical protein
MCNLYCYAAAGAIAASVSQHHLHDHDYDHVNDPNHHEGGAAKYPRGDNYPDGVGGGGNLADVFCADALAAAAAGGHGEEDTGAHASLGGDIAVEDFPLRALECILDEATVGRCTLTPPDP